MTRPLPSDKEIKTTQPLTQTRVKERKLGATTYRITTYFNPDSREGLIDKLVRLIENDPEST